MRRRLNAVEPVHHSEPRYLRQNERFVPQQVLRRYYPLRIGPRGSFGRALIAADARQVRDVCIEGQFPPRSLERSNQLTLASKSRSIEHETLCWEPSCHQECL